MSSGECPTGSEENSTIVGGSGSQTTIAENAGAPDNSSAMLIGGGADGNHIHNSPSISESREEGRSNDIRHDAGAGGGGGRGGGTGDEGGIGSEGSAESYELGMPVIVLLALGLCLALMALITGVLLCRRRRSPEKANLPTSRADHDKNPSVIG